jgi:hypothetical protein
MRPVSAHAVVLAAGAAVASVAAIRASWSP